MLFVTGLLAGIILAMAGVIGIAIKENEKLEQKLEHEKYQEGKHHVSQEDNAEGRKGAK